MVSQTISLATKRKDGEIESTQEARMKKVREVKTRSGGQGSPGGDAKIYPNAGINSCGHEYIVFILGMKV